MRQLALNEYIKVVESTPTYSILTVPFLLVWDCGLKLFRSAVPRIWWTLHGINLKKQKLSTLISHGHWSWSFILLKIDEKS